MQIRIFTWNETFAWRAVRPYQSDWLYDQLFFFFFFFENNVAECKPRAFPPYIAPASGTMDRSLKLNQSGASALNAFHRNGRKVFFWIKKINTWFASVAYDAVSVQLFLCNARWVDFFCNTIHCNSSQSTKQNALQWQWSSLSMKDIHETWIFVRQGITNYTLSLSLGFY